MKLYYTSKIAEGAENRYPYLSLGGYRAITLIPNSLNNLFGEITQFTIENNQNEYIAIILHNDSGGAVTDIMAQFTLPSDSYSSLEIAAVTLTTGSDGIKYMESVNNINQSPIYATFVEAEIAVNIGNLDDDAAIGLWIKRQLDIDQIEEQQEDRIYKENEDDSLWVEKTINDPNTIVYNDTTLNSVDKIQFDISWT